MALTKEQWKDRSFAMEAERDEARAQRDALRADKRRLANAVALMCDQYLKAHGDADEWDDMAMTAGETATELLCEMGYARWDGGRITVPDREALAALEEA